MEFETAPDYEAVLAEVRSFKASFNQMTYFDEEDCILTQHSFDAFLALGEDAGQVLNISLDNVTGFVSRSNSDISSGWERVEMEDAEDARAEKPGQPNLPADLYLADSREGPISQWLTSAAKRLLRVPDASPIAEALSPTFEPVEVVQTQDTSEVDAPDPDQKDATGGEPEVKPKDSALERSCQVCRGLLRLHQPAPFAYWSCDGCGSRNLRKDAMWGCSQPDTCDWGLCTGCHPEKAFGPDGFVGDGIVPLAGMLLTGLILCSASRFSSSS